MAFGAATLGKRRNTLPFPTSSALLGLFANALGYGRGEADRLDALQAELTLLSREDRPASSAPRSRSTRRSSTSRTSPSPWP
jgi:CRISPR-associated Cas5-like protein